jgi:hypothetical protein
MNGRLLIAPKPFLRRWKRHSEHWDIWSRRLYLTHKRELSAANSPNNLKDIPRHQHAGCPFSPPQNRTVQGHGDPVAIHANCL